MVYFIEAHLGVTSLTCMSTLITVTLHMKIQARSSPVKATLALLLTCIIIMLHLKVHHRRIAISACFRSQLTLVQGNLTVQFYVTNILQPVFLPLLRQHGGDINWLVFQHDNIQPQTPKVTQNCLHNHSIKVLLWPSRSLDMNPIEHLWDELGQYVLQQLNALRNVAELTQAFQHHWDAISQTGIHHLCLSDPR